MLITQGFAAESGTWYQMEDIERKLLKGDSVSDDELSQAIKFFKGLSDMLSCLGPHWSFAFREANRLSIMCYDYRTARERRARDRNS